MTEYDPARDAFLSYEEAIRAKRAEYLLNRRWLADEERWETAIEFERRMT